MDIGVDPTFQNVHLEKLGVWVNERDETKKYTIIYIFKSFPIYP